MASQQLPRVFFRSRERLVHEGDMTVLLHLGYVGLVNPSNGDKNLLEWAVKRNQLDVVNFVCEDCGAKYHGDLLRWTMSVAESEECLDIAKNVFHLRHKVHFPIPQATRR